MTRARAGRLLVIVLGSFALGILFTRHPLVPILGLSFIVGSILGKIER